MLRPGTTLLRGQYTVTGFLSAGGFGITYLAEDSLDRTIVLKECFPSAMCFREGGTVQVRSSGQTQDFATIVRAFGTEARRLAKLEHPNIVGVHQVFEDNDTAYMALDYVEGQDLLAAGRGRTGTPLTAAEVKTILLKMLDAIAYIHRQDILHRDIAPDNILIDQDGEPILIDFGAAREEALRQTRVLTTLHTVKDGYSPYEFYVIGSPQNPSSDIYALGATFYHLIAGKAPPDSQARVAAVAEGRPDPFEPLISHHLPYDRFFVEAINKALEIFPKDRLQTAEDWIEQIHEEKRRAAALLRAKADRAVEDSIFKLVAETNEAVMQDRELERKDREPPAPAPKVAEEPAPRRPEPTLPPRPRRRGIGRIVGALWRMATGRQVQPNDAGALKR